MNRVLQMRSRCSAGHVVLPRLACLKVEELR